MKKKIFFLKTIIVLFVYYMAVTNVSLAQNNSPMENLKEYEGVQIYKPASGFLIVSMNWTIKQKVDLEEKMFLPYKIFDTNGSLYSNVHESYYEPITITLPAGIYYIKTVDATGTRVKFGVEIQPGKTTLVE
jgi:hypothetical protein